MLLPTLVRKLSEEGFTTQELDKIILRSNNGGTCGVNQEGSKTGIGLTVTGKL